MCWILSDEKTGVVIFSSFWFSPAQSFSGLCPTGIMTIFYYLRLETAPTKTARHPYLYPRSPFIPQSLRSLVVDPYDAQDYGEGSVLSYIASARIA
jgi:hypothetical protein